MGLTCFISGVFPLSGLASVAFKPILTAIMAASLGCVLGGLVPNDPSSESDGSDGNSKISNAIMEGKNKLIGMGLVAGPATGSLFGKLVNYLKAPPTMTKKTHKRLIMVLVVVGIIFGIILNNIYNFKDNTVASDVFSCLQWILAGIILLVMLAFKTNNFKNMPPTFRGVLEKYSGDAEGFVLATFGLTFSLLSTHKWGGQAGANFFKILGFALGGIGFSAMISAKDMPPNNMGRVDDYIGGIEFGISGYLFFKDPPKFPQGEKMTRPRLPPTP